MVISKMSVSGALQGEYDNESDSTRMTFFAYHDPGIGDWRQLWLDGGGKVIHLQGKESAEDPLILTGHQVAPGGKEQLARAIFSESEEGIAHVELAISDDEGANWRSILDASLVPQKPSRERIDDAAVPPHASGGSS